MDVSKKYSALRVQSGEGRTSNVALLYLPRPLMVGAFSVPVPLLGSNEATYGLREGGAGLHRNRPAAGKATPTLSAGIVRRVRNADGGRRWGIEAVRIAEADGRAGAHRS